jgi:SAM-dependent methyltransferase
MTEPTYVFSKVEEQAEFERLRLQERIVDWMSMGALSFAGIGEGARCLEAGVGAGSMTRWMASRVGHSGRVLGVDLNDRLFAGSTGPNIDLVQDDMRTITLPDSSFDYVHCRTLLLHLQPPERPELLRRFQAALRPGGWLVAVDPAIGIQIEGPDTRAKALWRRMCERTLEATASLADFNLGPSLAPMLANAGFESVDAYGGFGYITPGGSYERYLLHTLEVATKPVMVSSGHLTEAEIDELIDFVKRGQVPIAWTTAIAWGQRAA